MRRKVRRLTSAATEIPQTVWYEVFASVSELDAEVIRLRFGLDGRSPKTVTQVAKTLKLGRERVRQIEAKALNRLSKIFPQCSP